MPDYSTFKGVTSIGDSTLSDNLKSNLKEFFDWAFLGIGSFYNVNRPQSGVYGIVDQSKLRLVSDDNYRDGQVWETFRKDWVWESGIEYATQPIAISGIYVGSTFYSSTATGQYSHYINYPLGRVIFNNPIPTNSNISLNYSYRHVQVYTNDVPWFQELQFNSFRADDSNFLQVGSGNWDILGQSRIQLPAIIIEPVPRRNSYGMQLGGGMWVNTDVMFHVLAENPWDRDKLFDIITYQKDRTYGSFDKNKLAASGVFPLDQKGSLTANPKMYPELANPLSENPYFWKRIFVKDMKSDTHRQIPPFYRAKAIGTFEMDFPEI